MNKNARFPKVSIVTSVYNNAGMIADAIESVISQTYGNIEYIVVDGGSTDGTVEVVKRYESHIATFVSEPDKGIYDGLNKGIGLATGDVVGFLHSDDLYADAEVVAKVAEAFREQRCDAVYGDLVYVLKHDTDKVLRYWKSGDFKPEKLKWGWMPPHPALFVRRDLYENHGSFDLDFKIAADYDFMLRVLTLPNISTVYVPELFYRMRIGGESNKSLKNILRKSSEDLRAMKKNGVGGWLTLMMKNLSKVSQFIFR